MFAMEYKSLPDESSQHTYTTPSDPAHDTSDVGSVGGASIRTFFSKSTKKSRVVDGTSAGTDLSEPLTQPPPSETTSVSSSLRDSAHGSAASGGGGEVELGRMDGNSNAMEGDDPFYVFKEDLVRKLTTVDEELTRYLQIIHGTDSAVNTHEVKATKKQLKRHLKHAESTLKDLQKTVKLVDSRRSQFVHISNEELDQRRVFVSSAQDRIKRCKADMSSEEVKEKLLADERALSRRRMGADPKGTNEDVSLIVNQHAQSQLMLQEQDETLEELDDAVERVGQMAGEINAELGHQNKMLQDLEDDLADAEEKLGLVMGKLAKLLKTKSKCQLGTILILLLTAIVLFFLVLYT